MNLLSNTVVTVPELLPEKTPKGQENILSAMQWLFTPHSKLLIAKYRFSNGLFLMLVVVGRGADVRENSDDSGDQSQTGALKHV